MSKERSFGGQILMEESFAEYISGMNIVLRHREKSNTISVQREVVNIFIEQSENSSLFFFHPTIFFYVYTSECY